MRKLLSVVALFLPLLLRASGQFGISTPLVTYVPPGSPYNTCLTGAWPMNEGSGTTFHDITGNGNTLTLNNGSAVTWQANTGLPGTTPFFNGTGYAIGTNYTNTNFTGTAPFSVFMWTTGGSVLSYQQQMVGSSPFSGTYKGWAYFINYNTGVVQYQGAGVADIVNTLPTNAIQVVGATAPTGTLHYHGFTYDGSQSSAGVLVYEDAGPSGINYSIYNTLSSSAATNSVIYVGAASGNTNNYTGALADLAIYNCVVTPSQVAAYFAAGPRIN